MSEGWWCPVRTSYLLRPLTSSQIRCRFTSSLMHFILILFDTSNSFVVKWVGTLNERWKALWIEFASLDSAGGKWEKWETELRYGIWFREIPQHLARLHISSCHLIAASDTETDLLVCRHNMFYFLKTHHCPTGQRLLTSESQVDVNSKIPSSLSSVVVWITDCQHFPHVRDSLSQWKDQKIWLRSWNVDCVIIRSKTQRSRTW